MVLLELVRRRREVKECTAKVTALSKLLDKEHATVRQASEAPLLPLLLPRLLPVPVQGIVLITHDLIA